MATKTVLGVFDSKRVAEEAISDLRKGGFDQEISILAKKSGQEGDTEKDVDAGMENLTGGISTGGVLGGLAGLAAGAGALAIPGIGPLVAAGPIAGLLSGAATGGVAGGLVDWGIPEAEGKEYEEDIKQGKILVSVHADPDRTEEAEKTLRDHGAENIQVY